MKQILTGITLLIAQIAFAQSYDEQLGKAGEALQKKEYCSALAIFKTAFKDTTKTGAYDFAYAAVAAVNCNDDEQALAWLKKGQQKGLGQNTEEINGISNDSVFLKLRKYPAWSAFVSAMKQALVDKELLQKKRNDEWVKTITDNKIKANPKGKFKDCKSGFALYFSKVDTLEVPYLVYVPKTYNAAKPTRAIVYLHGGVANESNFNFKNAELGTGEPIFSIGDTYNSIIIYPFGKKDFGWIDQLAAFKNVITIVDKVKATYNVDAKNIFLGGMSNGGTATFWFATQKPNIFKGFYALSALPFLKIESINFNNITEDKPFYSVHAKDDDVYKFEDVNKIYNDNKAAAKGWNFDTLPEGGHGFIYQQNGREVLESIFKKIL